jgi:N utilization substance protein A
MADATSLVAQLFAQEIPEIASGKVKIRAIARIPGRGSKLALQSEDSSIDCVGACVGIRGYHVKNIVDALGGERLDLIRWNDASELLIINALQPARIEKVNLHPSERCAVVVVKSNQVSLVFGRGGENRQLASELTGWRIEVEAAAGESSDDVDDDDDLDVKIDR